MPPGCLRSSSQAARVHRRQSWLGRTVMRVMGFPLWTETAAVVGIGDAFTRLRRLSRRPEVGGRWRGGVSLRIDEPAGAQSGHQHSTRWQGAKWPAITAAWRGQMPHHPQVAGHGHLDRGGKARHDLSADAWTWWASALGLVGAGCPGGGHGGRDAGGPREGAAGELQGPLVCVARPVELRPLPAGPPGNRRPAAGSSRFRETPASHPKRHHLRALPCRMMAEVGLRSRH